MLKRGSRVLGISESSLDDRSYFVGVVSSYNLLEHVAFDSATYRGLDATDAVLRIRNKLKREDIRLILLSGRIVAGYNLIDLLEIHKISKIPVAALPYYSPRKDIRKIIERLFEDYERRIEIYERNIRYSTPLVIGGRRRLGIAIGIEPKDLEAFLNKILIGRTPYPIYLADRIARGLRRSIRDIIKR